MTAQETFGPPLAGCRLPRKLSGLIRRAVRDANFVTSKGMLTGYGIDLGTAIIAREMAKRGANPELLESSAASNYFGDRRARRIAALRMAAQGFVPGALRLLGVKGSCGFRNRSIVPPSFNFNGHLKDMLQLAGGLEKRGL